jgi:nitroreductase
MTTGNANSSSADVIEKILISRHSCRGFLDEPVPRPTMDRLLSLAQRTASWCNTQPWQVLITSGVATERFRSAMEAYAADDDARESELEWPSEYRGIYLERRRECGFSLFESVGISRGDRVGSRHQAQENFRFFGAPHVAIITTDKALGPYGAVDCGGYVATFLLAAESLGVAAIPQAALAGKSPIIRRFFDISDDRVIVCGISFGYEDRSHPANGFRTTRAALREAVRWVDE